MAGIPTCKGLAILQLKEYIREKYGEDSLKKWLDCVTPEEYILLTQKLMPVSKVPAPLYNKLYQRGKTLFGGGKGEYYSAAHEYVGEKCLNSFMKFFMRLGTPSFVAHNAPFVWGHFFDTGRLVKTAGTSNSVELVAEGGEGYGEGLCYAIIGFGRMAINMSGGKNIRVNHDECRFKGQTRCRFKVEWD